MPQMANITIKKSDGTTDQVFVGLVPSAGEKSPAVWRPTTGTSVATRPELRLVSSQNGTNSKRIIKVTAVFPVVDPVAPQKVIDYISFTGEFKTPLAAPDLDIKEAVYQICNLMASALVKDAVATGFAPS